MSVTQAAPVLANFDEIDASAGDVPITSPYLGFTWTNFTAYTATPGFAGFNNGIVSPLNAAYSGGEVSGSTVTPVVGMISTTGLFDFTSAAMGAGYYDGLAVTVQGLRGGVVLFSQSFTLNVTGAITVFFNFAAVDNVTFLAATTTGTTDPFACGAFNCTQFTLDNVLLTPVPEPSIVQILLAGLAVLSLRSAVARRPVRTARHRH
jgi:hypothetical protein